MKIETKQELKYVMDFYKIPFVPISDNGRNFGKITADMRYEHGEWYFRKEFENMAFELAFEQVKDVIELKENLNKKFSAIAVHKMERDTWMYADKEGGEVCHHVYPKTETTFEEKELTGTMDEVFVKLYKWNRTYRYCNGDSVHFKDKKVEKMYWLWLAIMPESRSFSLYYGNGIVD